MLQEVSPLIRKVSYRENLTAEEVRNVMNALAKEDTEGYYHLAFTFGMMAKKPSPDELFGFCQSYDDCVPKLRPNIDSSDITDLSGTGGDIIKTFNVSTTASFIVAGCGIHVAKQCARAWTSLTGARDLLGELGVDIPIKDGEPKRVEECLERVGIAAFYYPSFSKLFLNRVNFTTKMFQIGLRFVTPFHLTAHLYSPVRMDSRIYGVFDEQYLRPLAEVLQRLGLKRGMIIHGLDGLDEVSTIGPTKVCEFEGDSFDEYVLSPGDFGLKKAKSADVRGVSKDGNVMDFLKILYGSEVGPKRDIALANAAAALYITKRVNNLEDGVGLARSSIESGKVAEKLDKFISYCGSLERLNEWKKKAGLPY